MIFLNKLSFPIRWVDMDAYGHVSNAKYFDYMSETRATWFSHQKLLGNFNYVVVSTACQFKKELSYPREIVVEQYFKENTKASFTLQYIFKDMHDLNLIYAEGEATLVCLDLTTKRAVRLPLDLREAFKNNPL